MSKVKMGAGKLRREALDWLKRVRKKKIPHSGKWGMTPHPPIYSDKNTHSPEPQNLLGVKVYDLTGVELSSMEVILKILTTQLTAELKPQLKAGISTENIKLCGNSTWLSKGWHGPIGEERLICHPSLTDKGSLKRLSESLFLLTIPQFTFQELITNSRTQILDFQDNQLRPDQATISNVEGHSEALDWLKRANYIVYVQADQNVEHEFKSGRLDKTSEENEKNITKLIEDELVRKGSKNRCIRPYRGKLLLYWMNLFLITRAVSVSLACKCYHFTFFNNLQVELRMKLVVTCVDVKLNNQTDVLPNSSCYHPSNMSKSDIHFTCQKNLIQHLLIQFFLKLYLNSKRILASEPSSIFQSKSIRTVKTIIHKTPFRMGSITPDNPDHRSFTKTTQLSQPIKISWLSHELKVQFMILLQWES
ncbi:hypothetical protein VP01_592g4 [Puccinia sorghi]|uniref:Uncharacterized protein n=1 Tax=Puccinia sorghi TaxID=27349 RepID=A0A0L6UHR7_9BASI|nr:hypothetical protein VP01_592g4 [Puccinia sorghi]